MLYELFLASATEIANLNVPLTVGVPDIFVPLNMMPAGKPETAMVYGVQPPVGAIVTAGYEVPTVPWVNVGVAKVKGFQADIVVAKH